MLTLKDETGKAYGALAEVAEKNGVNGERSLSGTIYSSDDVIHGVDRGWSIDWKDEVYKVIYAEPIDNGETVELQFDAVHQFFYDMKKSVVNGALSDGSHTMRSYLDFIFNGSGYRYSLELEVPAFEKQNFGYRNRLDLFNDIVSQTGVEFTVNGANVRIIRQVGQDLSSIVKKGFNLNELKIEKNIDDFVTYKRGYGAWHDEEDHSKGRLTTEYLSPLSEIYGVLEDDPVVDERYTVVSNLQNRLKHEVDNSYTLSVGLNMEALVEAGYDQKQPRAGDYIMAINDDLGFKRKVRIVSYTSQYDINGKLIDHDVECNSLGMVQRQTSNQSRLNQVIAETRQQVQAAQNNALQARASADGKNTVFYGHEKPNPESVNLTLGDIWFNSASDDVIQYVWNGVEWRRASFDREQFNRIIADQTAKLNAFTEEIETVRERADEAIESAGGVASLADRHGELINNLRTDADNALANAGRALDNINDLSQSAQLRFQELSDEIDLKADWAALAEMDRALKEDIEEAYVNATGLVQSLDSILTREIEEAQANARELVESAENKFEQALDLKADQSALESLDQSVNHELEVLDNKLSLKASQITVDSLSDTVTVQKNRLDHTIEGLEFKADREDVDTLERTVTEQGNRITVNEQGLTQKADRSVVDDLNKTVEQQGLELRSTSEGLALKADRSTVNNLSGRVSTAENNIKVNADEINRRLTKSEVDSLVDGKGYATQTYVSNSVRETADNFNRTIESVERQIPKHYQNRNLLRNSDNYIRTTDYLVGEWPITDFIEDGETVTISMMAKSYSRTQVFSFYNTTDSRRMTFFPAGNHDYEVQYWEHTFEWDLNAHHGLEKGDKQTLQLYNSPLNNGFHMEIVWIKLERGDRGTGHTLAPEDLATVSQVNDIESTVTRHSTQIDATSQGLTLKADKSHVDTINQEVSEQSLQISALNDGLALKANQSTVNTLTGRVSSAENRISANANEISQRLTRSEVNNLIDGRNLATQTYVSNSVRETADNFNRTIESVERQIPKHYQNRNLLRNSDNYIRTTDYLVGEWPITDFIEDGETVTISMMAKSYSRTQVFSFYNTTDSRRMTFFPAGNHDYEVQYWEHTFTWDTNEFNGLTKGDNQTLRLYNAPFNNGFNMEVLWIKLERGDKATTHTVAPEDFATVTKVNQLESTVDGNTQLISSVRTTANGAVQRSSTEYQSLLQTSSLYERVLGSTQSNIESNISRVVQTSGIIQQEVEALERGLSTRITQTENNISVMARQVDDLQNTDLISEINIQADRQIFRVGDGRLMLTQDTTYINNNLITNRMLASGITADKITTGTLDASRARIINLDVNNLTGNLTNFVQTNWNRVNSTVSIDGRGLRINARTYEMWLDNNGIDFTDLNKGDLAGQMIAVANSVTKKPSSVMLSANPGYRASIGRRDASSGLYHSSITVQGRQGEVTMRAVRNIGFDYRNNSDLGQGSQYGSLHYAGGSGNITLIATRGLDLWSERDVRIGANRQANTLTVNSSESTLLSHLNMNFNSIRNNSDIRLKTNFNDKEVDSLQALLEWRFTSFDWKEEPARGRQFGIIAQTAPDLVIHNDSEYLSVDSTKQLQMTGHAIQQLSQQTTSRFKTQEDQIFELQQELSKANRRIKELEEAK